MIAQNDFEQILNEKKIIKEPISTGDFSKRDYPIVFEKEDLNHFNLILSVFKSGSIEIKYTIQKRAKGSIPLLRLDINGFHRNPPFDKNLIDFDINKNILSLMEKYNRYNFKRETHLHYYIQNFNERWAFPPKELGFVLSQKFDDNIQFFCDKYNIEIHFEQQRGLF